MIAGLIVSTFLISFIVATIVVIIFSKPIDGIMQRIVPADISNYWTRYLRFAIYVVGIAGGVRLWDLEKYLTAQDPYRAIVKLTSERWLLEIYATVIGTLQSTAMVLLVFFVFALIAVVIVRIFESRPAKSEAPK